MTKTIYSKIILRLVILIIGLSASSTVFANTNSGKIAYLAGTNASLMYISLVSPPIGYAGCALQNRYVIDISSVGGRAMYSIALTAKATNQLVTIVGAGICNSLPGDAEDVLNVITNW